MKLPEGVLAQHVIALGKTGAGKSSALRVLVEGMLDHDKPVCIIDPKGDWWGIKSSANGKSAGYPLVVFGGEHADVPINDRSGAHVAELVATGNRSCLIDLGGWMVGERTRFFIDFASSLFKHARGARHLVIDEIHNFAPQGKVMNPDAGKMLHWANRLASEGRGKGITILAASQRPQKVAKDFVTSCETLIAMRVIHVLDRNAIKDWIDGCADPAKGKEVIGTLAQMKRGEAWIWSPEIEYGPTRVTFPMFKTYDSFKPQPAAGGKLKGWADVDLEEVKARMAAVLEEAKANDPGELKRRIAELERQARTSAIDTGAASAARNEGFQEGKLLAIAQMNIVIEQELQQLIDLHQKMLERIRNWRERSSTPVKTPVISREKSNHKILHERMRDGDIIHFKAAHTNSGAARMIPLKSNGAASKLSKAARNILSVLSQYPEGCTSGKLTLLTGYSYSGSFQNALSELRTAGCIEGENTGIMRITAEGCTYGPFPALPQGEALVDYWVRNPRFSKAGREILSHLASGDEMTADQLCAATGYSYSGSFQNALSELRTAGVIEGKNTERMRISREIVP